MLKNSLHRSVNYVADQTSRYPDGTITTPRGRR